MDFKSVSLGYYLHPRLDNLKTTLCSIKSWGVPPGVYSIGLMLIYLCYQSPGFILFPGDHWKSMYMMCSQKFALSENLTNLSSSNQNHRLSWQRKFETISSKNLCDKSRMLIFIPCEAVTRLCGHRLRFASWSNILLISIEIDKILLNWANRGRSVHGLPAKWNGWHGMTLYIFQCLQCFQCSNNLIAHVVH